MKIFVFDIGVVCLNIYLVLKSKSDVTSRTLLINRDVKLWTPKDGQLANPWSALATYHTQHKEALSECLWIERGDLHALVSTPR